MRKPVLLANAVLWAAAILAAAVLEAPTALTLIVLPLLAAASWVTALTPPRPAGGGQDAPAAV